MKGIKVKFNYNDLYSYGFNKSYSWDDIKDELKNIHFSSKLGMIIVFCDDNLKRYYIRLANSC